LSWGRALFAASCLWFGLLACVPQSQDDFPNRLVGADGQLFTVEDLEDIANDSSLTDDEKRDQFRALGIEDEKLINALLEL
jgi:hypothetical protein